jgi:hypothetical protein
MSNNFDGPIILDSLADAAGAAGQGYLGTGGRTGASSNGPRLAGGLLANRPAAASVPAGSLYLDQDQITLWMAIGAVWVAVSSNSLETLTGAGTGVVAAQTQAISVPTALPGDTVQATLQSDDTGGSLGIVTASSVTAPGTVSVTFAAAPTNGDGVVQVATFGSRQQA